MPLDLLMRAAARPRVASVCVRVCVCACTVCVYVCVCADFRSLNAQKMSSKNVVTCFKFLIRFNCGRCHRLMCYEAHEIHEIQ